MCCFTAIWRLFRYACRCRSNLVLLWLAAAAGVARACAEVPGWSFGTKSGGARRARAWFQTARTHFSEKLDRSVHNRVFSVDSDRQTSRYGTVWKFRLYVWTGPREPTPDTGARSRRRGLIPLVVMMRAHGRVLSGLVYKARSDRGSSAGCSAAPEPCAALFTKTAAIEWPYTRACNAKANVQRDDARSEQMWSVTPRLGLVGRDQVSRHDTNAMFCLKSG